MKSIPTLFITSLLLIISLNSISQDYEAVLDFKGVLVTDLENHGIIIWEAVYNSRSKPHYLDNELNHVWKKEDIGDVFYPEVGDYFFSLSGYKPNYISKKPIEITLVDNLGKESDEFTFEIPSKMRVMYVFAGEKNLHILLKLAKNYSKHPEGEDEEVTWITITPDFQTSETTLTMPTPLYKKFDFTNYWRVAGHSKDVVYLSTIYENKKEGYKCELLSMGVDGTVNVSDIDPGLVGFNDAKGEVLLRYGVSFSQKFERYFIHVMNSKNDGINMYCYDKKGELIWENESKFNQALKYTVTGPKEILVSQRVFDNGIVAYHLIQPFGDGGGQLFLYSAEDGETIKDFYYKTKFKGMTQSSSFPTLSSILMQVIPDGKAYNMLRNTTRSIDKKRDLKKASYIYTIKEDGEQLVFFLKDEVVIYFFKF